MKPAVSLVAVAGRRRATLELASRLEREGFTGIYCPSPGDGLALCEALALVTREIPFGTTIAHIYTRHAFEYAQTAAVIHELSGGRFRFGIGVSHGPAHERLGLRPGKPLPKRSQYVCKVVAKYGLDVEKYYATWPLNGYGTKNIVTGEEMRAACAAADTTQAR